MKNSRKMGILDIHTHHFPAQPGQAIVNVNLPDFIPQRGQYYSVGVHPWDLSENKTEDWSLFKKTAVHPQVLAIGEAGLDTAIDMPYTLQEDAFKQQITIASSVQKPLIIHCVHRYNEVIALKKTLQPDTPWIIHGFRGKKELARQLVNHGIYVSFGFNYHEEAMRATPLDMLFVETDESRRDIHSLYAQVAGHLSLPIDELISNIRRNINNVFLGNKSCLFK